MAVDEEAVAGVQSLQILQRGHPCELAFRASVAALAGEDKIPDAVDRGVVSAAEVLNKCEREELVNVLGRTCLLQQRDVGAGLISQVLPCVLMVTPELPVTQIPSYKLHTEL